MPRIVADINIYNGAQFLSAILSAIHEYVDKIVVVDGAWAGLLATGLFSSPSSTDASKKILEAFPLKCPYVWVKAPPKGWESHSLKRAAALRYLRRGDWQYMINDDELPVGDLGEAFEEIRELDDAKMIQVPFVELMGFWTDWYKYAELTLEKNRIQLIPRFFKMQNIFYGYSHLDLLDGLGKQDNYLEWKSRTVDAMWIVHLVRLRPTAQKDRKFQEGNLPDVHVRGSKKVLLAK